MMKDTAVPMRIYVHAISGKSSEEEYEIAITNGVGGLNKPAQSNKS